MHWREQLNAIIDEQFSDVVALRRYLHQHPEVSGEEYATSDLLAARTSELGMTVRRGPEKRGVIADLRLPGSREDDPVFAVRGDIDALRIQDSKTVEYASQRAGIMHACGHDAHAAMTFGVAAAVTELHNQTDFRDFAEGFRFRAIFQPAEETCRGALEMIEAGALEGVEAIIATHVDPRRNLGAIGVRSGVLTANCDHLHVTVHGQGGHAARPQEARDPIWAATQLISELYQRVRSESDGNPEVVIAFGQIFGGHNGNVIPDDVTLNGTLRTLSPVARDAAKSGIQAIAKRVGEATGTTIEIDFVSAADAVVNCPQLTELISATAGEGMDDVTVKKIAQPSMGGEDFAFYGNHVPAAMFRLGVCSDKCGGAPLHTSDFDLDEEALRIGIRIMAQTAIAWCETKRDRNGEMVDTKT